MSHLLHPELFEQLPFGGESIANHIDHVSAISYEARSGGSSLVPVSVVVRTLNEATELESLVSDIERQKFGGEVELVVVDNESTDNTAKVAKALGAVVRTLPRDEFTHPKSLNLGLEAANNEYVFVASSHISIATDQLLAQGVSHLEAGAAGAYAWPPLPNANASGTELLGIAALSHRLRGSFYEKTARWGILSMAGSMIRRSAWESVGGFGEAFETGGEDGDLAARLLKVGESIAFDPILAIHHTHGLKLVNRLQRTRRVAMTRLTGQGARLDRAQLAKERPDLDMLS